MEKNFVKIENKLYRGIATVIFWMMLVVIATFLPSCSSSTETETAPAPAPKPTPLKVIDRLEAIASRGKSSISVCYILLEDGSIIIYGRATTYPYSKEEARNIMALRRGEEVTVTTMR